MSVRESAGRMSDSDRGIEPRGETLAQHAPGVSRIIVIEDISSLLSNATVPVSACETDDMSSPIVSELVFGS